jgi:hypothetical protein
VTGNQQDNSEPGQDFADISLSRGRPDWTRMFAAIEASFDSDSRRAAVVACGPRSMVDQIWDETNRRTRDNTRFDMHHETVSPVLAPPL